MKKSVLPFCLSVLLGFSAAAQGAAPNVLVLAHRASPISYSAYLQTEDHQIAFSRFQLEHWHSPQEIAKLKESIATHLAELGQVPAPLLTKKYSQLLAQAFAKNWPPMIRNELASLWLTTYTLETDGQIKTKLLSDLARFHPTFQPSPTSFAPPVIASWRQAIAQKARLNWRPGSEWQGFRYIIVNGAVTDLNDQQEIILPDQPVHLTAISDQYYPVERILEGRELLTWQPTKEILLSGNCEQPQWNQRLPSEKIPLVGYFSDDCVLKMPLPAKVEVADLGLTPSVPPPLPGLSFPALPPANSPTVSWKWMILGGLVAGLVGVQLAKSHQEKPAGPGPQPASGAISHQGF